MDKNQKQTENEHICSPEKKRVKQATSTKAIQIVCDQATNDAHQQSTSSSISNENGPHPSLKTSVPLWVAGSSPAKFVSLEDLIKMNDSIEKMAIVHQIAVDPKFKVEDLKSQDPLYETIKLNMHKAYWDLLRDDLSNNPQKNEHGFMLLKDLKTMIIEHLESNNLKNVIAAIEEALDLDHLRHMFEQNILNFKDVLHSVLSILERLCAPVRDELTAKLKQEEDTVELFKGIFNLVELMRLDMANFTLSQNRQLIRSYSAKIEFDEFMKLFDTDKSAADNTKLWLMQILVEFLQSRKTAEQLTRSDVNELIVQFYLKIFLANTIEGAKQQPFPETILLDAQRIEALSEKLLQLELTVASIFVACNLLGKAYCGEGTAANAFKSELKQDLLVILNDVDWKNYTQKLEYLVLQCDKKCKELVDKHGQQHGDWTEAQSKTLKQQLLSFADIHESVRSIARNRIRDFICQVLRQSSEPLRVPPGLGIVQTELASLTSHYYAIAVHNWNAFGRFYGQLLDEEYNNFNQPDGKMENQKKSKHIT